MKLKQQFKRLNLNTRLYSLNVPIIGLTGGIASGKSTVSEILISQGLPVIDADRLVKNIYILPEILQYIENKYPFAVHDGAIVFPLLRKLFFSDTTIKTDLENLIYPNLPSTFMSAFSKFSDPQFIIYDIPLLFEKNLQDKFDFTVLVYSPRELQRDRLMKRDGHTEEMADTILKQQMDIEEKTTKADYIIMNHASRAELKEEVSKFLRHILE